MANEPWRDLTLLSLFRQEVAVQAHLMSVALTNLQISGPNPSNMEMLRTSAHAVKGAARIVNLMELSNTAGALEKLFERDLVRDRPYDAAQLQTFEQAIQHIAQVATSNEQDIATMVGQPAPVLARLTADLKQIPGEEADSPNWSPDWVTRVEQIAAQPTAYAAPEPEPEPEPAAPTDAATEPPVAPAAETPEDLEALAAQLGLVLPSDDSYEEDDSFDEAELAAMMSPGGSPLPFDTNLSDPTPPQTPDEVPFAEDSTDEAVDLAAWAAETGIILPSDDEETEPTAHEWGKTPTPSEDEGELSADDLAAMAAQAGIILPDENEDAEDAAPVDLLSFPAQSPVEPTDPTLDTEDLASLAAAAGIILPEDASSEDEPLDWAASNPTQGVPVTGNYFDWSKPEDEALSHIEETEPEPDPELGYRPADLSMLDLFRTEAETHTATLVSGLLALERRPEALDAIHELMRAAHSLKVAASIVQFPILVDLAHGMEDKLVATQKGTLRLNSEIIDLLLAGVDVFTKIIEVSDDQLPRWLTSEQQRIVTLTDQFRTEKPALTTPAEPVLEPESGSGDGPVRPSGSGGSGDEAALPTREARRHVRISAEKLDRLMAVSSQFFVATRGLDKFGALLSDLKRRQLKLNDQLQRLEANLGQKKLDPHTAHTLAEARREVLDTNHAFADALPNFTQSTSQLIQLSNQLHHTVISSRMTPFGEGVQSIPRMVRDLARLVGKKVNLEIRGSDTEADRDIIEKLLPPLKHLVRNALDHGIETPEERLASGKDEEALLLIDAHHQAGMLTIMVEDDGRGINYGKLRKKIVASGLADQALAGRLSEKELLDFLFLPGFSTAQKVSSISGRGVGLDVVYSMVHEIGGSLRASSQPGRFMRIQLNVPVTLSVVRTLILEIEEQPYAVPLAKIRYCSSIESGRIYSMKGRRYMRWNDENVGLVDARQVLGLPELTELPDVVQIVFFQLPDRTLGLIVDRFLGHRHLVVRPIDERIGDIPDINAAAIMEDGRVVLIFHADDLMQSIERCLEGQLPTWQQRPLLRRSQAREKCRILVVDDSATVREVQRQILQEQGFQVDLAEDGILGLKALGKQSYDLIISDVDMPRMNGLKFIQKIRANPQLSHLPVLMVSYRDSDGDRTRGLDAGADAYLTKNDLYATAFIETVQELLDKVATRH